MRGTRPSSPRTEKGDKRSFFSRFGGRKNVNGYLYALLISVAAWRMESVEFEAYALWLAVALLGTSAIVATEDIQRSKK